MGRSGTLYYRLVDAARTVASVAAERPHRERQRRIIKFHGRWYEDEFGIPADQAADIAAILYAGLSGAIERWATSPGATTRRRLEETYVNMVIGTLERVQATTTPATNGRAKSNGRNGSRSRA
jgi:hypothetical protein